MPTRRSPDIGTRSIGWVLLELDDGHQPTAIRDLGLRVLSDGRDPKSGASRAADRRLARQPCGSAA
jgi:CRISPR-associated endonuclease Csn1